jgi:hypothetical protein
MLVHPKSKVSPVPTSRFYRCPGCGEMVNERELSEVLKHHQHVLDPYRFRMLGLADARVKPRSKRNLRKTRPLVH